MNDRNAHARGWFLKADSDLRTAQQLLRASGPFDTACFHAQQTVEKLLKALLAYLELDIPHTHNLEELQQLFLASRANPELAGLDLTELTPYAVEMRYDFEFWPDEVTTADAVALAEQVRQIVLDALPPEVHPS